MSRVMVVFGGRSGEHDVSLSSARAVIETLEKSGRHEVVPVGITRSGRWISSGDPMSQLADGSRVSLPDQKGDDPPGTVDRTGSSVVAEAAGGTRDVVVFPVLHGPYGEDGTIQGMLEMAGVPYVGSGVLGSSVGMDKVTMKKVFDHHTLPQVDWTSLTRRQWKSDRDGWTRKVSEFPGFPCFVKPSNLGSSVGITRADTPEELASAIDEAATHDRRIIIEAGVDAREVEVSVLGNEDPEVSSPGEILIKSADFYDYEAKYGEDGMDLEIPANVPEETSEEIRRIARDAFVAVDAAGMARIDFFVERETGRLYLNEINTIPGFTATSVYAKLWAASGLPYEDLLDRLIALALERHAER